MENEKKESEYLDYVMSQMYVIEDLSYFNNITKYPQDIFLLGIYNFVTVLKEHNMHLAVALTKVPYNLCAKTISNTLNSNICDENNCVNYETFDNFLSQFKQNNNGDGYYKKFSASLPVDKLCNDLCQSVLEKSWIHIITSLVTFEFVIMTINKKLNEYAKKVKKTDIKLLPESSEYSSQLLKLIDCEDKSDIKCGVTDTLNAFCNFFNEIDNLYYNDN